MAGNEKRVLRAAAYERVSTEDQAKEGVSIPAQSAQTTAYCAAQGWRLVEHYVDEGFSAKDTKRPALRRLVADAKAGQFDAVVIQKLDRLSRNSRDTWQLIDDVLEPSKVGLVSITENFDTVTPAGRAMLGMLGVFAQFERESIVARTQAAKKQAAVLGRWPGGTPHFAYRYDTRQKKLVPDPTGTNLYRYMVSRFLDDGWGLNRISQDLNGSGRRAPRGGFWTDVQVRQALESATPAGFLSHKGTRHEGPHEPAIPPPRWHQLQREMARRRADRPPPTWPKAMLSGISYCGLCGARLHTHQVWSNWPQSPRQMYFYYSCSRQLKRPVDGSPRCTLGGHRRETVDEAVLQQLHQLAVDPASIRRAAARWIAQQEETNRLAASSRTSIAAELADIEKRLKKWYDAFEEGAVNPVALAQRTNDLLARKLTLAKLQAETSTNAAPVPSADEIADQIVAALRRIDELPRDQLAPVLRLVVSRVTLFPDRMDVKLYRLADR